MTTPLLRRPSTNLCAQTNAGALGSQPGLEGGGCPPRVSRPPTMTMPARWWRTFLCCGALALPLGGIAQTVTVKPSEAGLRVEIDGVIFTEYVTKDGSIKGKEVFEKLEKGIEKAKDKGQKGVMAKITHEKKVISKIQRTGKGKKAAA